MAVVGVSVLMAGSVVNITVYCNCTQRIIVLACVFKVGQQTVMQKILHQKPYSRRLFGALYVPPSGSSADSSVGMCIGP